MFRAVRLGQTALLGCRHLSTTARVCAVQLKMPSLSPTMSEGTIVKWLKVPYAVCDARSVAEDSVEFFFPNSTFLTVPYRFMLRTGS
jgi:hypothetical protein